MTISILAFDEKTGSFGGAATTGSLCVGGWVLRGDPESGMSASQGSLPSTIWGEDVLRHMRAGQAAQEAVGAVVGADDGRDHRQLTALDPSGRTGAFTGCESVAAAGSREGHHFVVAGNLLTSGKVLDSAFDAFRHSQATLDLRLLAALDAAAAAGGDSRGLISAALLLVNRSHAPLTLRIDHSDSPLKDLRRLHVRATSGDYAAWSAQVPTLDAPFRGRPLRTKVDQDQ